LALHVFVPDNVERVVRKVSENTLLRLIRELSLMFLGKLVCDQATDHRFTSVASWLRRRGCPSIESGSLALPPIGHSSSTGTLYDD
jgi:hypothetical protein